jgi:transcription termination factor Rho
MQGQGPPRQQGFQPRHNNNDRMDRGDRFDRGDRGPMRPMMDRGPGPDRQPTFDPSIPRIVSRLDDLYRMPMPKLFELAEKEGIREHTGLNRAQLIVGVVRRQIERGEIVKGTGTLEVLPDGYGFLRSAAHNYLASPEDIYVSPSQIRRMSLRTGYLVEGPIRLPIENQDNFALMQIEIVNGKPAEETASITGFTDLTPLHPCERLRLEGASDDMSMRIVDLVTPIGKGQRGLIVAPPRTGKTILLAKMANAILKNHPECYVFVLLIDERPEEVTEMQKLVVGTNVEVVASTFDEPSEEHIHVADIVLEKAKRMVELKKDVVILLDSITRLARAHNTEAPGGGKLLSGGLDSNAMQKPKQFFGAARNVEEGGSLTILATALIETGSRMDDVIFEEFKGTGNMELHLDRRMVEKRIYPAIDVNSSGTRKEDLLTTPEELAKIAILRRVLADMHPVEAMELLLNRGKKTKTNAEFLMTMNLN